MADQLLTGTTLIEDTRREFGKVLSIPCQLWTSKEPDTDDIQNIEDGGGNQIISDASAVAVMCGVSLPQGVKVISVIVHGNAGIDDSAWTMFRNPVAAITSETMATANGNTADTTISFATIDNESYRYHIVFDSGLAQNDRIYGAVIIYE